MTPVEQDEERLSRMNSAELVQEIRDLSVQIEQNRMQMAEREAA